MNNQIKQNHGWLRAVKLLTPMINILHGRSLHQNLDELLLLVNNLIINEGEKNAIRLLKAYRTVLQQYVLRQTVVNVPFRKADRDGFPQAIKFLKPNVDDIYSVRYSLSMMRIIESFRCKPEYLVSTIEEKSTASEKLVEDICSFIRDWKLLKLLPKLGQSKLVMSNRAGPNGPATITAIEDLTALRQSGCSLIDSIKEMMGFTSPHLNMDSYKSKDGEYKFSKLVLLSDKACKTRVIAIADWWSNTSLEALHSAFMKTLNKIQSDVTYRQSQLPVLVKELGKDLFSSDMTAFTDRFPRKLEVCLIEAAYGTKISELWDQITTNRTFHHPQGGVRYECGNPMGLLSSWPVSTLTHHAVKHYCAYKLGIRNYKYLILGDDTLDTRGDVYQKYLDTIQGLGVQISLPKCSQSNSGYTEFAKRLFTPSGEATGLPVHLLEDMRTKPEQVLELVRLCRERGYEDSFLRPFVAFLLKRLSSTSMIADILSLPEEILGAPPLFLATGNTYSSIHVAIHELSGESRIRMITIARDYVFWTTSIGIHKPDVPRKVCQVPVEPNHPLVFALSDQLMNYLPETEDEFSIYNSWMKGEYRYMANVPNIDTYRYYNKGHYATKCKFDVLRAFLRLVSGDCNIPLHNPAKLSNFELFELGFRVAQDELLSS